MASFASSSFTSSPIHTWLLSRGTPDVTSVLFSSIAVLLAAVVLRHRALTAGSKTPVSRPLPTLPSTPSTPKVLRYTIPDFISRFPYPLRINPHYDTVAPVSFRWAEENGIVPTGKNQLAAFKTFPLLAAMSYPDADHDRFRIVCDYMSCLFTIDDLTDEGPLRENADGTRHASDIIMNALYHPLTYKTDFKCGKAFADFWGRAMKLGCSAGSNQRLLEYMTRYLQAMYEQVIHRTKNSAPTLESYIQWRRDTGAVYATFAFGLFALDLDLPDEVFESPEMKLMEDLANDVVVLSNDIYSYAVEHFGEGEWCNLIDILRHEKGLDIQGAIDMTGELVNARIDLYVATKAKLQSWGPKIDADVEKYTRVLEAWMAAGFHWSFTTPRYFRGAGPDIAKTLAVEVRMEGPSNSLTISAFS